MSCTPSRYRVPETPSEYALLAAALEDLRIHVAELHKLIDAQSGLLTEIAANLRR